MKRTLVPPDPPDMNLNTARVNELHITNPLKICGLVGVLMMLGAMVKEFIALVVDNEYEPIIFLLPSLKRPVKNVQQFTTMSYQIWISN